MEYKTDSVEATAALAAELAGRLKAGDILFLQGDLGTGKSVFARGLIRALSGDTSLEVPSPTFTLVQIYETDIAPVWHFDLYRIEDSEEIYELGWEEALTEGICVIEWPERLDGLAPQDRLTLNFTHLDNDERLIRYEPHGAMAERFTA